MAAYVEYHPGPTISSQHSTLENLLDAFWSEAMPEKFGSIGGSSSLTWYLTGASETTGANPSINLTWSSTTGGHTATTFVRHDAALNGMLDPAYTWQVRDDLGNWLRNLTYAEVETWRVRAGSTNVLNASYIGDLLGPAWMPHLLGGGSTTGIATSAVTYTEGSRVNTIAAFDLNYAYDPTAGELSAGVKQSRFRSFAILTGADDGTLNLGTTGASIGTATINVPVPVVGTASAQESWLGMVEGQLTNKNNVTNAGDLGEAGGLADEPDPGDARPIFIEEGAISVIVETPSAWLGLTTLPAMLMGLVATLGFAISTATSVGIWLAIKNAADAITGSIAALGTISSGVGSIATAVSTMATTQLASIASSASSAAGSLSAASTGISQAADALDLMADHLDDINDNAGAISVSISEDLSPAVNGIPAALEWLGTASVENDLVSAIQLISTAEGAVATNLASVASQLNPGNAGSFARRAVEALESIADSIKADAGTDPATPKLATGVRQLQDRLGDVADLVLTQRIRAKGIQVDSAIGAEIED